MKAAGLMPNIFKLGRKSNSQLDAKGTLTLNSVTVL